MADAMNNSTSVQVFGEPQVPQVPQVLQDQQVEQNNQVEQDERVNFNDKPRIQLKLKLGENGQTPKRAYDTAVGFDLCAAEEVTIKRHKTGLVPHNFEMALDSNCVFAELQGRSSNYNKGLLVMNGVIDNDYRGPIKTVVYNFGEEEYTIKKDEKISQFVFKHYTTDFDVQILREDEDLPPSKRGKGGFGSTDKAAEDDETKDETKDDKDS